MSRKSLFVVGIVGMGLVWEALAALTVGAGETLHSTDAALDAWRTVTGEGENAVVRYTPEIVLNGGTFVLDDAVKSEFAGTVSGVGALELRNTADVAFAGGAGLAEGATVLLQVAGGKVTLGDGNVFGGATSLQVSDSLVWGPEDADIVFPATLQTTLSACALYARSGRTWTINGPVIIPRSASLANYGTFVLTGELSFVNASHFLALYEGTTHDFSAMTVAGGGELHLHTTSTLKLPTSETATNLLVKILSGERGRLDLGGANCALGEIQGESRAARIVNSGNAAATLTLSRASMFKGVVESDVNLVVPGGSQLRANGLTTGQVTAQDGTVTLLGDEVNPCLRGRYLRFVVDKVRTTETSPRAVRAWDIVAFAEIVLTTEGGSVHVPWPAGTTATQEYTTQPTTCGAELVVDGDTRTKTCVQMTQPGFSVKIDMQRPVSFNGYKWWTADDSPQRDPISWHLELSNDGEHWTVVDTVNDFETTKTRSVQAFYKALEAGTDVVDVLASSSPVLAGDETALIACGSYRWTNLNISQVSNLVLNGTVLEWNASMAGWRGVLAGQGSVDLVGAADTVVEVPFACAMPGISFINSGSTAKVLSFGEGSVRIAATGARHVRFRVSAIRNGAAIASGTVVALSEFALVRDGQALAWPEGTTATQLNNFNKPTTCDADKLIDGQTSTKHCIEMWDTGFCVQFDLPEKIYFEGYRWWTADDAPQREPSAWTIELSDDGVTWTVVDMVTGYTPPVTRQALAADRTFEGVASRNVIADGLIVQVNGALALEGMNETVAGLVGTGTVSLAEGSTLTLDVPANTAETIPSFSGTVMCEGTLVKEGEGTQRLSGRIDCDRLVLRGGVLDVRGATFSHKVEIVQEGGRLYGMSGMVFFIR